MSNLIQKFKLIELIPQLNLVKSYITLVTYTILYSVSITQYNMIVKYELKGYANHAALPDEQQTVTDISIEAGDGDILIKFNKLLVEDGGITLLTMVPRSSYIHLLALLVREMAQTGSKLLLILARLEPIKFIIPIKESG